MDGLNEIGSGISSGVNAVGSGIGNLFGGGGASTDPTGGGNPGAGALNGGPGAVAPASLSPAGTGASGALPGPGAAASGGLPLDLSQVANSAPAVDPVSSLSTQLTGAPSPDALTQGLAQAGGPPPVTTPSTPLPTAAPALAHAAPASTTPLWEKAAGVALPFALNALTPQPGAGELKQMKALQTEQQTLAGVNAAAGNAESQGLLPQPAQALIQQQLQQRVAQIKSEYAKAGMSGSSAENADIAAAKEQSVADAFTIGNQMAQTALTQVASENSLSDSLLKGLYQSEVGQSQQLQQLIQKMAGLLTTPAVPATKAV